MAFGHFKDGGEKADTNENKEASVENKEKNPNPEKGNEKDFDKKIEAADKKETKDSGENGSKEASGETKGRPGFFENIKNRFAKQKETNSSDNGEKKQEADPEKSASGKFRESLKVRMTQEEIAAYNKKNGYPDMQMERPKGGVERQRGDNTDPRREAYAREDTDNQKRKKNDTLV